MTTTAKNRIQAFSTKAKQALEAGQEITQDGLVWRKRRDGTGTWRYDFARSGARYKGAIGAEKDGVTLSQARETLATIKAQVVVKGLIKKAGGSYLGERLFSEVAGEYEEWSKVHRRSRRHSAGRLKNHLLPNLGHLKLKDISTRTVEELRTLMLEDGFSRETVKRVVSLLSSIYTYARQSDPMLVNPTSNLAPMKSQEVGIAVYTRSETERLLH